MAEKQNQAWSIVDEAEAQAMPKPIEQAGQEPETVVKCPHCGRAFGLVPQKIVIESVEVQHKWKRIF